MARLSRRGRYVIFNIHGSLLKQAFLSPLRILRGLVSREGEAISVMAQRLNASVADIDKHRHPSEQRKHLARPHSTDIKAPFPVD